MNKILFSLFFLLCFNYSFSQPAIQWQKCLGGTNLDEANSVQQTADGGFIVAGLTESNDGDVTGHHGLQDYWVVKLDSNGSIQWQKCLGGTGDDVAYSVQQAADGGYIVAGRTASNNGDVTGHHGGNDYWVVKLDGSGNLQWQKCLGGTGDDLAYSVQQTADGGYVVTGNVNSNNGDVTGNHGNYDSWIVKLDGSGNLEWQKCQGGTSNDGANSILQTADGGFMATGYAGSNDGDVSGNQGVYDYWLVKLDTAGDIQWQKCFGGTSWEVAYSGQQTAGGGFIAAGYTESNDGDVTGHHGLHDYWVVKPDDSGNVQWQKCLGGTNSEYATSVRQTADGGYIVAGFTGSNDGDVSGNHGNDDYWLVKLESSGNVQWQKCLGGTSNDVANAVQQTIDGGYIVVGNTASNNGDVSGLHGATYDFWVVKLSPFVGIEEESSNGAYSIFPSPFTVHAVISFDYPVYNATFSLYNLLGEKVAEVADINGDSFEFNRGNLPSGVYVFEVSEKNKSIGRGKAVVY